MQSCAGQKITVNGGKHTPSLNYEGLIPWRPYWS